MIRLLESKPFLFFFRDHLRSTLRITCGRGSFAVHFGDHLRSRDHLRLGIICGTVQYQLLQERDSEKQKVNIQRCIEKTRYYRVIPFIRYRSDPCEARGRN